MALRIAIWHNLPSGGGKRALFDQVQGMLARGHQVEVWCPPTADLSYLPLNSIVKERVLPFDVRTPPGWLDRLSHKAAVAYLKQQQYEALDRHCRRCAREIEEGGFDVLLASVCRFVRVAPIARYVTLPRVIFLHEPNRWLYEALPALPWAALPIPMRATEWPGYLARRVINEYEVSEARARVRDELESAKAFDRILVNSRFSRESVLRAYGLQSSVCYLGVDASRFPRPGSEPRADAVVGVGAVIPEKNVEFVLEAIGRIPEPRPALWWVGNAARGEYVARLKQRATELGVALEIHVNLSEEGLRGLLTTARLMAYAPRLEPFGYAPLEANACGLPVVAVAEGGVRETIVDGQNGLLVDHDPDAFASAIDRLRQDPDLAATLGQQGRRMVEDVWSLDSSIDRLERQLMEVHSGGLRHSSASA